MPCIMLIRIESDYQVVQYLPGIRLIFIKNVMFSIQNMTAVHIFPNKMKSKMMCFFISAFLTPFHCNINKKKFYCLLKFIWISRNILNNCALKCSVLDQMLRHVHFLFGNYIILVLTQLLPLTADNCISCFSHIKRITQCWRII